MELTAHPSGRTRLKMITAAAAHHAAPGGWLSVLVIVLIGLAGAAYLLAAIQRRRGK